MSKVRKSRKEFYKKVEESFSRLKSVIENKISREEGKRSLLPCDDERRNDGNNPELDKTPLDESVAKTYITQLYEMVGNASSAKACGWEHDGLSIYVFDSEELGKCLSVRLVFPSFVFVLLHDTHLHTHGNYYQASNFKSFARQLHIYGFKQIKSHSTEKKYVGLCLCFETT